VEAFFINYEGHLLNAAEIRTVSPVNSKEWAGIHIDYRHGGFTDIPGGELNSLLALMQEAQKALAPF
jgi:hypothetical protein